jgi:uncharacterized DUF497 family protein
MPETMESKILQSCTLPISLHATRILPIDKVYTIAYKQSMRFEWDEAKNRTNYRKHGIWFEEAQTVWADSLSVEFFDPEHCKTEDRFLRIGCSGVGRLLLIVFCEREAGGLIRIISARKATSKERKTYEEGI